MVEIWRGGANRYTEESVVNDMKDGWDDEWIDCSNDNSMGRKKKCNKEECWSRTGNSFFGTCTEEYKLTVKELG